MAERITIEGILEAGQFRQTNGTSFNEWLAAEVAAAEKRGAVGALRGKAATYRQAYEQVPWLAVAKDLEADADQLGGEGDQ